ncbi:MAG: GntR family transcriptional regulator [Lachnospiraceae bacterium]|nr:GntR family transcriptional regulator [Lachnospiraceae bacterium]
MDIILSNSSNDPIYLQIVNQIKAMILSGELAEGEALPSMRNLALQMRISVITTKRAYEELEREGFIESYTGKGSFVKGQNAELLRETHLKQIEDYLSKAAETAKMSGIELSELTSILELFYDSSDGNP